MIRSDFHVHTTCCDGRNSLREMAEAACVRGMERLGFSGHSYTWFDESYCMSKDGVRRYLDECSRLKEEYAGRLEILCGVEQDLFSTEPTEAFDYVIGSAHYLFVDGVYYPVDSSADELIALCQTKFGGDWYALAAAYFETVGQVVERTDCDLIGHFDLICKYNQKLRLFDENDPRYVEAWRKPTDALLKTGRPFEINTGPIGRGYRDSAYPAPPILDYLKARGARFILSSDSHRRETLCCSFEAYACLADPEGVSRFGKNKQARRG